MSSSAWKSEVFQESLCLHCKRTSSVVKLSIQTVARAHPTLAERDFHDPTHLSNLHRNQSAWKPSLTPAMAPYKPVDPRKEWHTGVFARLPWLGLAALVGAAGCCAAAAFVLIHSDGKSIHDWTLQPTVYLAIASAAANILLHFALAEGVNVAWWRRSLKEGTTVNDLHRYWNYGNSLWAATTSGKHFNLVALASIFAALTPINGPLLQRASTVTNQPVQGQVTLSAAIAPVLPDGYSGIITGRLRSVALLSPAFTSVMREYTNRAVINMSRTDCDGVCQATLKGAGFAVNCSESTVPYTLVGATSDGNINWVAVNGTNVFTSNFTHSESTPGDITLVVTYKGSSACNGDVTIKTCLLRAATVDYPVIFRNDTVTLNDATTITDDGVDSISQVTQRIGQGPTTLGGVTLALSNKFDSTAHMRFVAAAGYEVTSSGSPPNEYVIAAPTNSSTPTHYGLDCGLTWADPTADLLAAAREVMFRSAVAAGNSSTVQRVLATESTVRTVYRSNYIYLGLALLLTLLGVGFVTPIFFGWWHLGRNVSLSPVETAKAFSAPLLRGFDSNGDADTLLKDVGDRTVKYGEVAALGGRAVPRDTWLPPTDPQLVRRLEMASPEWVRSPQDHMRYSG